MALKQPNVPTVFSLLRDSLNADQTLRGPAVDTLYRYESRLGFCSYVVDIITAKGTPSDDDVRHSASIYLQKIIDCYWRNRAYISEHERINMRNKLLSHLQEENDQTAKMLVIIISKIACSDYPEEWPDLFSDLAKQLEEGDIRTSGRILEVLSSTISTLSRKDLGASGFAEISSQLLRCFLHLWKKDEGLIFDSFLVKQSIAINTLLEQQLHLICERLCLCLSIIQRLIIQFQGDANTVKVPPVMKVCDELIQAVKSLAQYYYTDLDDPKLSLIHKVCVNLMKCLFEIQRWHPTSFDDKTVCDPFIEFCLDSIMKPGHDISPLFEEFLIECMVMVKSAWKRFQYKLSCDLQNVGNTHLPGLRSERVQDLCEILITRYFLLTDDDLKKWSQDPEWFYHETGYYLEQDWISKEPTSNTDKLRLHADALYVVVFKSYGQLLGPFVTSIFHDATQDRPAKETDSPAKETDSHPEMFLREAAYTAVAHVCDELFDKLDFKKLFEEVLYPDIQNNHHPYMCIMHRKIAFIIQNWAFKVDIKLSSSQKCPLVAVDGDTRKQIFCALLELLTYDDLAVRLAACQPLVSLVEKVDFQKEASVDLLLSYWDLCFELLEVVQDFHSKCLVLDCTLSGIIKTGEKFQEKSVITKIGEKIIPFANKLVEAWKVPTGSMFMKSQILQALHCLSELGIHSPFCYNILLPVLKKCCELNDPDRYFMKYGMLLWGSTISHAPSMDSQLQELFPHVQGIMKKIINFPNDIGYISDLLKVGIKIIHGYITLGGRTFLSEHASVIQKLLVDIRAKLNTVRGFNPRDTEVLDFVASIAAKVEGLNTDKIDPKLNIGVQHKIS